MEPTQGELESLAHVDDRHKMPIEAKDEEKAHEIGPAKDPLETNDGYRWEPKHWAPARKWTATLLLSAFAFLQPLSETMLSPVEKNISQSLHITRAYEWLLVMSKWREELS